MKACLPLKLLRENGVNTRAFAHTKIMEDLYVASKKIAKELTAIRRKLHQNAELGFSLDRTLKIISDGLAEMGYTPQKCGRAGVLATVGKGEKCFLLRADMDALPVGEQSGEKFASKNGNMHACGHDMHAAMLLGAAKLLKAREKELKGQVKLLFQPAEESLEGAKDVIEGGALQNPRPQGGFMLHVMTAVDLPVGSIVVASGESAPAADFFTITVKGKGCHGSAPWNGVDALTASARIALGLEEISARELSIADPAVLTIGSLNAGNASNVIANEGILKGTLRAFDENTRLRVKRRLEEVVQGTAKAFRVRAKVAYGSGCPTLVNDEKLVALCERTAKSLFPAASVFNSANLGGDTKKNSGGSEDFAYISREIPTVMAAIAAGERKEGYEYPLHHPKVRFDERALPVGAALYAGMALSSFE